MVVVVHMHIQMCMRGEGARAKKNLKLSHSGLVLGESRLQVRNGGFCSVTGSHATVT
jgi:hypothetical protein